MKRQWTKEEEGYIKENFKSMSCKEMAKKLDRTEKSVQHRFSHLELDRKAKIGDIINGWKILDIYIEDFDYQKISMAKIESLSTGKITETRLTKLTNNLIGRGDEKRPDLSKRNTTHGQCGTRLHRIWNGMKARCMYPSQKHYPNYGGRGIKVCEVWQNFDEFYKWAIANGYTDDLSIDRIDSDGNYCPENCRWSTSLEQCRNKDITIVATAFGETKSAQEWAEDVRCKCSSWSLIWRIKEGWTPELAITKPSKNGRLSDFKRWKALYKFIKNKHPEILDEFIKQD